MMETDEGIFADVLAHVTDRSGNNKRDPRSMRLAAVVAALIEVVATSAANGNNEGGSPSAAHVYASAITALEGTLRKNDADQIFESLATQVALLDLLSLTMPHVQPPRILSMTLPLSSRILRAIVASCQNMDSLATIIETKDELGGVNAVLRGAVKASTALLRRLDQSTDETSVAELYTGTLLVLCDDRRPKVRKAAHSACMELLNQSEPRKCHAAISKRTLSYLRAGLRQASKQERNGGNVGVLLHELQLLEGTILHLNYDTLGAEAMELLVALIQRSDSSASDFLVTVKVKEATPKYLTMSALLSVMLVLLRDDDAQRKAKLDEFAPRVLASLVQVQTAVLFREGSAERDVMQTCKTKFGEAVLAATSRVIVTAPAIGCKLLPLSVQVIMLLLRPSTDSADDRVAQTLLVDLTHIFRAQLPLLKEFNPQDLEKASTDTLQAMRQVFQPVYQYTWSWSLTAIAILIEKLKSHSLIQECVEELICTHSDATQGSAAQHEVENAMVTLIQAVGIETVWGWVQWNRDISEEAQEYGAISAHRAWILRVMKSAAMGVQPEQPRLAFFQSEILDRARKCDRLAAAHAEEREYWRARVLDLWSLFPCFCEAPCDYRDSLPSLTATLCKALEDKRYTALVVVICNGLHLLATSTLNTGSFEGESNDQQMVGTSATRVLPILFKLVMNASDDKTLADDSVGEKSGRLTNDDIPSISAAVASLCRLVPSEFLHGLFKKLMQRLLEEVEADDGNASKICSYLSLSQALVASQVLDEPSISFLYRSLKPLVRSEQNGARVQKNAYKLLAGISESHHAFIAELSRLKELVSLLSNTIMTSQISARYMRLKCMNIILDGFEKEDTVYLAEFLKGFAEILLCLKDSNGKTREAAYQLLISLARKVEMPTLLQTITGALGAETPHMRSGAVMALSRIVFEYARSNEDLQSLLPSLLSTVLVLIDENAREVIKSVIGFIRVCVAAIPHEQLEPLLPGIIGSLLRYQKAKSRFRSKIKIIVKKLVKIFGYDALLPFVPESETRLLTHMRKTEERLLRQKLARKDLSNEDAYDNMVESGEDDSDDGRTLVSRARGFGQMTSRTGTTLASKSPADAVHRGRSTGAVESLLSVKSENGRTAKSRASPHFLDEANGEVLDLLGAAATRRARHNTNDDDESDSDESIIEFDGDGRIIVRDVTEKSSSNILNVENVGLNSKRRRLDENGGQAKKSDGKQSRSHELGAAFKSKKAGGDVKKKGQKFEPYAFVPLNGKSYSKKNRRVAVEQMSSVVKKAKKRKR